MTLVKGLPEGQRNRRNGNTVSTMGERRRRIRGGTGRAGHPRRDRWEVSTRQGSLGSRGTRPRLLLRMQGQPVLPRGSRASQWGLNMRGENPPDRTSGALCLARASGWGSPVVG